jgi:hypothetical protein
MLDRKNPPRYRAKSSTITAPLWPVTCFLPDEFAQPMAIGVAGPPHAVVCGEILWPDENRS